MSKGKKLNLNNNLSIIKRLNNISETMIPQKLGKQVNRH